MTDQKIHDGGPAFPLGSYTHGGMFYGQGHTMPSMPPGQSWPGGPARPFNICVGSDGHVYLSYMADNPHGHGPVPASFDLTAHIKSVIREAVAEALAARAGDHAQ